MRQDGCLGAVLLQGAATPATVAVIAGINASKVEDGTAPALVRNVNWCAPLVAGARCLVIE